MVAAATGKPLILIRKPESCHTKSSIEGFIAAKTYIIIDDFICTGNTINTIINAVKAFRRPGEAHPKLIGIFLYNEYFNEDKNYLKKQARSWDCWITSHKTRHWIK